MADHMQQQIVLAAQVVLTLANTDAGADVFVDRLDLLDLTNLPSLNLKVGDEQVSYLTQGRDGRATLQRDLQLEVTAVVGGGSRYRERATELMAQAEEVLAGSRPTPLTGLLHGRPRLLASRSQVEGQGAQPVYVIRSMWQFRYFTAEGAPRGPVAQPTP